MSDPSRYRLRELRQAVAPMRVHFFARLGSTSARAAELARAGKLDLPAMVLTGWQVAGRGRGTNTWWSSSGSLTVTFAFASNPNLPPHHLPLISGIVLRRIAASAAGDDSILLKWPNDLLFSGRKLAGLLCERVHGCDLVGIGLNVNLQPAAAPPLLRDRITSLMSIRGAPIDHTSTLIALARALTRATACPVPLPELLAEFAQYDALSDNTVTILEPDGRSLTGIAAGLDESGRLIVRAGRESHHIISGQVQLLRAE